MALLEFTYNFIHFSARFVKLMEQLPKSVSLRVEIRNAFLGDSQLYVIPYGTGTYAWLFNDERYKAPEPSMVREISVNTEELTLRPEVVAYSLVEKVYLWFGAPPDKIPYVSSDERGKFIDVQKIMNVKG